MDTASSVELEDRPLLDGEVSVDTRELDSERFKALVNRLSRQSVEKFFNAYLDIPWDDPDFAVDPDDPRWESLVSPRLRETDWYQAQPPGVRSRLGLYTVAGFAKIGLQFENVLKRGLLEFGFSLPNHDPRFRYVYHEMIEEGQHALMFQEFVNRSGWDPPGLPRLMRIGANWIPLLGRRFPPLFFLFVLGGEDPIDHVQREALRSGRELPPILERISRIHVTEEARHLSFARSYLKLTVPRLDFVRRQVLAIGAPLILGSMAQLMTRPNGSVVRQFGIPGDVVRSVWTRSPEHQRETVASLRKFRQLCRDVGLVNPVSKVLWRALRIWDDDEPAPRSSAAPATAV